MNIKLDLSKFSLRELIEMKKEVDKHLKFKMFEGKIRIDHCDISARAYNSLNFNGIFYLEDLAKMSIKEFSELKNVGKYTVSECTEILEVHGMNWRS
jgi:DNA-directed RNA polymerase alpha subunit